MYSFDTPGQPRLRVRNPSGSISVDAVETDQTTVELGHVGIFKVAPERSDPSAESISRIRAEMYVETMKFVLPAA